MKTSGATWSVGDRVIHTGKPEWGTGVVLKAQGTSDGGKKAQRLEIRFARAGVKTLSTAFAKLDAADEVPAIERAAKEAETAAAEAEKDPMAPPRTKPPAPDRSPSERRSQNRDQEATADRLANLDPARAREVMSRIPEGLRDPFNSLPERLRLTLDQYKYRSDGRTLLDWGSVQSGLADPLSAFSRHELEQHHQRFRIALDNHLQTLVQEAKRLGVQVRDVVGEVPPDAKHALRRMGIR